MVEHEGFPGLTFFYKPTHGGWGCSTTFSDPSRGFCIYMKISDMSKADLLNYMRASHELVRYDRNSAAWKRAFQLARKNGLESVEMDCQSCVNKVKTWLEK